MEWNLFLAKLFMNKLYFIKTEIIYAATQYILIFTDSVSLYHNSLTITSVGYLTLEPYSFST